MTNRLPVLDDDHFTGSVIGYATTERGAARVYRRMFRTPPRGWRIRHEAVTYDPTINTAQEARDVERNGAWAPLV